MYLSLSLSLYLCACACVFMFFACLLLYPNTVLIHPSCAWVAYGCSFAENLTLQWRIPLALASLAPVILACVVWLVPESPRYLSWSGQNDEALVVLQKLHRNPEDPNDNRVALAELLQISQQVAYDKQHAAGYLDMLWRVPSWRRRSLLVLFLFFASQSSGILGIANYSVLIYQNLGLTGHMPLLMYGSKCLLLRALLHRFRFFLYIFLFSCLPSIPR